MRGLIVAISMLAGMLIAFYLAYKRRTGRNLFKDIFDDMRGRL